MTSLAANIYIVLTTLLYSLYHPHNHMKKLLDFPTLQMRKLRHRGMRKLNNVLWDRLWTRAARPGAWPGPFTAVPRCRRRRGGPRGLSRVSPSASSMAGGGYETPGTKGPCVRLQAATPAVHGGGPHARPNPLGCMAPHSHGADFADFSFRPAILKVPAFQRLQNPKSLQKLRRFF